MKESNDSAFLDLANAIILAAVRDYRKAVKQLRRKRCYDNALATKRQCMKFFKSDWFKTLTSIDGEQLLKKLDAEVKV